MNFLRFLKHHNVVLDGATGTLLQAAGLKPGEKPENMNLTAPRTVINAHKAYFDAGSNVVCTNTFGANCLKFDEPTLEKVICAAIQNAKCARKESLSPQPKFVALDVGPTGKLLAPLGELDFEDAVEIFAKTVRLGVKYGADLIVIETMNDSYETKAALLAAKENSSLPVIVTNAYGADGKLMTGATPEAMAAMLEGLGADAIGANCSLGPKQLRGVIDKLLSVCSVPVVWKPNAGLPKIVDGKTVFDVGAEEFARDVAEGVENGVRVVGGCCGTSPDYIAALCRQIADLPALPVTDKGLTVVSSYTHAVTFGENPVLIGERINPTGKKKFKEAVLAGDVGYILGEAQAQSAAGVHVLDVNVGLPGIDEPAFLQRTTQEIQKICDLPLQIDTANPVAMERALRRYNGKALINSVNGKQESIKAVLPLVKKYGGVVVALTLDDNGIPQTAEGRVAVAKNLLAAAKAYGISKKDIVFDTLAMTVSADQSAANVTLRALSAIRQTLGCHTSLGVSNVSFGLPCREAINATFFSLALAGGLSAAILNPYSQDMMKTYHAFRALRGLDENCADYLAAAQNFSLAVTTAVHTAQSTATDAAWGSDLQRAVMQGRGDLAERYAQEAIAANRAPLEIVNGEIIPALDAVGTGFEDKKIFLPQLLMSADAAKQAFAVVKAALPAAQNKTKPTFVIATVKGDVHDIGKNIVALLMENYGYDVVDLGKDVAPERVVQAAKAHRAPLVGLSALMTTTVPAMEQTVELLRREVPSCKIVVGGAVLTAEYAQKMGADYYAKDAMETVRYAERTVL